MYQSVVFIVQVDSISSEDVHGCSCDTERNWTHNWQALGGHAAVKPSLSYSDNSMGFKINGGQFFMSPLQLHPCSGCIVVRLFHPILCMDIVLSSTSFDEGQKLETCDLFPYEQGFWGDH